MNFSILLASRERVNLLESLLNSLEQNTADKKNTEVIVVIDDDDYLTHKLLDRIKKVCSFAKIVSKERSKNLNDDYLNWAWKNYATGDYIIVCNDDCVFSTPNWDQIALVELNKYLADKPDGITYGWIEDSLKDRAGGMNYCCFPLVSNAAAKVLDWVMPAEFPGWGADIGLWRIYSSIDRVCNLSDVKIDHISYHSGKRVRDHVSYYVEQLSASGMHPMTQYDSNVPAQKLLNFINKRG